MSVIENVTNAKELIEEVESSIGVKANAIEQLMGMLSQIYDDDKQSDMVCTMLEGIATMLERDRKKAEEAYKSLKEAMVALR